MSNEQVWVNGIPTSTIAGVGGLKYSHAADGGCEQASWTMGVPARFTHPALVRGALVEIKIGPARIWSGILDENDPSPDSGTSYSASGYGVAEVRDALALDNLGATSTTPNTIIDRLIAGGMPISRPTSLSSSAFSTPDASVDVPTVGTIIDGWAHSVTKRWGIDEDRRVYAAADSTEPTLHIAAGAVQVGLVADDEYASTLKGRYMSGVGSYATVTVTDPNAPLLREYPVDLTPLGIIDATKATNVLTGMLAKGKARYAWTSAMTLSAQQLTTPGGQPVFLPFVRPQTMVRVFGVINEQGPPLPYIDTVLGRTEVEAGSKLITLSPVALAPRTLGDFFTVLSN